MSRLRLCRELLQSGSRGRGCVLSRSFLRDVGPLRGRCAGRNVTLSLVSCAGDDRVWSERQSDRVGTSQTVPLAVYFGSA